ncbi:MAG: PEP-utilizing enzyme [Acidimicrobiales bacterium]
MEILGQGLKVFEHGPVSGRLQLLSGPEDVIGLMDGDASETVALVREAGATFLAPLYHELRAIICTNGTPRSHIGIMCREFQLPGVMAVEFADGLPDDGTLVEIDCSGDGVGGVIRG